MILRNALKRTRIYRVLLVFCLIISFSGCGSSAPSAEKKGDSAPQKEIEKKEPKGPDKVLVVHSYHPEYEWVASIDRGIKSKFVNHSADLQFYYMDTLRNPSEESKKAKGAEALQAVRDWKPDLIISADDNAQAHFGKFLIGADNPPMIFCGVNKAPETYGYPAANITGIHEVIPFNETMVLAKKLFPDLENTMLLSEKSPTTDAAIEYIQKVNNTTEIADIRKPETFEAWKEAVNWANDNAQSIVIYRYHSYKDAQGSPIPSHDVIDWTMKAAKIPVFSSLSFAIDDGVLCGVVESGIQQGQDAAEIGIAILAGESIENFPVQTASNYHSKINLSAAKAMNLRINEDFLSTIDVIVGDLNP